jgi:hypothetical protein
LSSTGNGVAEAGASFRGGSAPDVDKLLLDTGNSWLSATQFANTANPYLFAISKAAGTATPRLGWKLGSGGAWTHEDFGGTDNDQTTATMLEIGAWQNTDFTNAYIGVVAWWSGAMSDLNKEALDDNWRTSDWYNSAHGTPVFLAELNVAGASVVDLIGNASSITVTGTTLDGGETLNNWNFNGTGSGAAPFVPYNPNYQRLPILAY